ncbi:TRAP transporter large permease subunit [Aquabacterium sp.]|uniref:TRAP transporter large permease subunit n=1 Tax=Aquabacterium TaxID=92793 RepID=UPI001DAE343F|nr:TRAP transporter large permease subunit [Aquabacterium sp.]MBT9610693.1 TRAP transporter large permease subunit [Aquabacterium sp.]|tara:strand:- start:794 stop:2947 length:2154 start_codon:yes stop_codon:yes gene_type:complete
MNTPPSRQILGRTFSEWFSSLPVFALLLLTLIIGTGEMVHGQLLKLGESMFGDPPAQVQYFMLRAEPSKPECNPNIDIDAEVAKQSAAVPAKTDGDDIDDLFGDQKAGDPAVVRKAVEQAQQICKFKHDLYEKVLQHQTPQVKAYRTLETSFFGLFQIGTDNRSLILLLMVAIAAVTTTLGFHHIGIRPGHYTKDYLLQSASQVVSSGLLLYSTVRYYQILDGSGVPVEHPVLHYIWMALFAILLLINLKRVVMPVKSTFGEGDWTGAFLSIPLYAQMATVAGVYFLIKGHDAGLAIYINQLMELPSIFMNLGLFIWSGMLLKQSRIVDLFMNILRPWSLSPQMLTYIILIAAAWATAYTGASGVFVIAAGGIIYHEVRASGGSRQFALAATAMSGSLGVVLRPCLLVVLIAALNKQVTTSGLYHWGFYVFLLTSTLFFLASQMLRTQKANIESPSVAIPAMLRQIVPTIPYLIVVAVVVWLYEFLLETKLNEITAPTIMPVILLIILVYDKMTNKGKAELTPDYASHRQDGVEKSIRYATNETIGHIGALLSLMTLSLAMGGVIERSELMGFFPKVFENHWTAMTFLVVTKVLLGMIMDPFGAVVLVSGTLAPIAYANNIDPLHFWMMVLVAFELGYLLPPVAINQLLTRQVIGEEEVNTADREVKHLGFYRRYERWILPLAVMTVGLAVVSYAPLAVHDFPELKAIAEWFPKPPQ